MYPRNAPLTVKGSQCALSVVCRVQQEAEKMIMKIMKDLGKEETMCVDMTPLWAWGWNTF